MAAYHLAQRTPPPGENRLWWHNGAAELASAARYLPIMHVMSPSAPQALQDTVLLILPFRSGLWHRLATRSITSRALKTEGFCTLCRVA